MMYRADFVTLTFCPEITVIHKNLPEGAQLFLKRWPTSMRTSANINCVIEMHLDIMDPGAF